MSLVSTELSGGVLTTTLWRAGKGNALDADLVDDLRSAVVPGLASRVTACAGGRG